jgi:hypothetical protein
MPFDSSLNLTKVATREVCHNSGQVIDAVNLIYVQKMCSHRRLQPEEACNKSG